MKPPFAIFLSSLLVLLSCTQQEESLLITDSAESTQPQELYDVSLTFSSSDFTITTQEIHTRAASTEIPEHINRLSLKVFDGNDQEAAALSQTRESLAAGETFGTLSVKLPAGTYTFVAILHEVPSGKTELAPATITSTTLATLPSSRIYDTYCCVQQEAITAAADQNLTLALGTRINATFWLETLDAVPADIRSIFMAINPDATKAPSNPTFNPTTGLATDRWQYEVNLTATTGQTFDRGFSVLLTEDPQTSSVELSPVNTLNKKDSQYQRTLTGVTLKRNHQTRAQGYLFKLGVSLGFTLDTSLAEDININF